jgi:hypothetical protein|tara:strand:- start:211 stop:375 length:165 start_codon:yes stop_codon:yes gene_type:complete
MLFELLLYVDLKCTDAAVMLDRIESSEYLDNVAKVELIEVIQEATPHCTWDAND